MPTQVVNIGGRVRNSDKMKCEIDNAVSFLSNMLRNGDLALTADQIVSFRSSLETVLVTRYQDHWFPDRPLRGSAYRCVRIVNRKLDRLLASAAADAGVPEPVIERLLPTELTLWVDPDEVSYRIGEDGSVGVIYDARAPSTDEEGSRLTPSPTESTTSTGSTDDRLSPDTVNYQYFATQCAAS